jgi:hypothetical protein
MLAARSVSVPTIPNNTNDFSHPHDDDDDDDVLTSIRSTRSNVVPSTSTSTTSTSRSVGVRHISSTTYRSSSVFSGWTKMEWHHPDFLSDATVHEKEAWLESMLNTHEKAVDAEAFLVVLKALASPITRDAGAPQRAELWMHRLKDHYALQPTAECYQAVIQTWANANKEKVMVTINRAERWLNELLEDSEAHPQRIQPTIHCYNAFLDACTRGRSGNNKRNQGTVQRNAQTADAILRRLHSGYHHSGEQAPIVPNTESFNFVIRGWTRCKHDELVPTKVFSLLRLMESYQRSDPMNSNVRPNSKSYAMTMDALVSLAKLKARRCVQEGGFSHDTSKNGIAELKEAETILTYMHDLHKAGVEGVVASRVPYNILITGWTGLAGFGHQDAPLKAEEVLRKMFSHKDNGSTDAGPDRLSFEKVRIPARCILVPQASFVVVLCLTTFFNPLHQVMSAWAHSGHPNAGKRARWWLRKLWNDSELDANENLLPRTHTYNIAMEALGISEGALAAENLLLDLGDKYREERTENLCPNSESFAIVIRAWLQKADRDSDINERMDSLHRAVEWLSSLREVENENNLSTAPELFSGILRSARYCAKQRPEILELATNTLNDMRKSRHQVDYVSYSLLLQVGLEALSGPDEEEARSQFVETLFKDCCEDGLVSKLFVRALADSPVYETGWTLEACKELTNQLFDTWPLPYSWSRNLASPRYQAKPEHTDRGQHHKSQHKE